MWRWSSSKLAGVVRLLSRSRLRVEPHCGLSSKNGPAFCDTQSWLVSDLKNICFDVYFEISYIKCKCRQLFQSIIQSLFELISMIYGNTVKNCSGVKIFMILISWMFGVSMIITVLSQFTTGKLPAINVKEIRFHNWPKWRDNQFNIGDPDKQQIWEMWNVSWKWIDLICKKHF